MLKKIILNRNCTRVKSKYSNLDNVKVIGFWVYLMSDCILFATLFATYLVFSNDVLYNKQIVTERNILSIFIALVESFLLLFSSVTYGIVSLTSYCNNKKQVINWLIATFVLGFCFICIELYDFYHLIIIGYRPDNNSLLSSFFTLIGTHGLHVTVGLIWIIVMIFHIYYYGLNVTNKIRLQCLSLFWHFLDIIWVFVFTVVYLIKPIY